MRHLYVANNCKLTPESQLRCSFPSPLPATAPGRNFFSIFSSSPTEPGSFFYQECPQPLTCITAASSCNAIQAHSLQVQHSSNALMNSAKQYRSGTASLSLPAFHITSVSHLCTLSLHTLVKLPHCCSFGEAMSTTTTTRAAHQAHFK